MKGDFSRFTGLRATLKHYNQVLKQQGRVQLDADWNELSTILAHQRRVRTIDTIGRCGAPIHDSGFEILHPGDGSLSLLIASGRFYAGGLLCETSPSAKLPINSFPSAQSVQVDDLDLEGLPLDTGQWVQLITDETPEGIICQITNVDDTDHTIDLSEDVSALDDTGQHHPYLRRLLLYAEQVDFPTAPAIEPLPTGGRTDLVYLDVWERHTTPIEDPDLREVALGGPDTDTRARVIAQVKILPNVGEVDCADDIAAWNAILEKPDGRLSSRTTDPDTGDTPCELGESGGYLGLENHLYRVEIHDGSDTGGPTFKWSRDNAAQAYAIEEFIEETAGQSFQVRLSQPGKDDRLKIKQNDYVEISSEESDLDTSSPGLMAQVTFVDDTLITLDTDVGGFMNDSLPKLRRWDVSNHRTEGLTALADGPVFQLEDGIEIEFHGNEFQTGDYWVFSARTLTGTIEELDRARPYGVEHKYCKLAIVHWQEGDDPVIEDCRPEFPPLTELPAGAGGCCTVHVGPDRDYTDIQAAVNALGNGPGTVCIDPGFYSIQQPIEVEGFDITIKSCGGSSLIVNNAEEDADGAIFRVQGAQYVTIQDLWGFTMGSRAVEVENTLFFNLRECFLVCGRASDLNGVVTCQGLTMNTHIQDNLLMGMVGIQYLAADQQFNLHLNARMERNIGFVLQHGLYQGAAAPIIGLDLVDNLFLGWSLALLGQAFFPEGLFEAAAEEELYAGEEIAAARASRAEGSAHESIFRRNEEPARDLRHYLSNEGAMVRANAEGMSIDQFPTGFAVINLSGMILDANLTDNLLFGAAGVFIHQAMEIQISDNILMAMGKGVEIESLEGVNVADNMITAGGTAVHASGAFCINFSVVNNRLFSGSNGLEFAQAEETPYQMVWNFQAVNNLITSTLCGIKMDNLGILVQDLTITDNTLMGSTQYAIRIKGLDENLFVPIDQVGFQRVVQRNSVASQGVGILVEVSDCMILDNDININHGPGIQLPASYGIGVRSTNSVIANNTVQGRINDQEEVYSQGGIFLSAPDRIEATRHHQMVVRHNRIIGGTGNGIEIADDFDGLAIEHNQISNMGLNGIAVQEEVSSLENLRIKDNHISQCLHGAEGLSSWWAYAGIVLTDIRKAQISGNVICDNGNTLELEETFVSAIYADTLVETTVANNQCLNNRTQAETSPQAAIYVALGSLFAANVGVQITDNQVVNDNGPALEMGSYLCIPDFDIPICFALDYRVLISGNQFRSTAAGPIVRLHVNNASFSNNIVSCTGEESSSVDLGYGANVLANGNVISHPITGSGFNQQLIANLEF